MGRLIDAQLTETRFQCVVALLNYCTRLTLGPGLRDRPLSAGEYPSNGTAATVMHTFLFITAYPSHPAADVQSVCNRLRSNAIRISAAA